MKFLTMPALHVGRGRHVRGLSVFPVWTDAPTVSGLGTGTAARVRVDEREPSPVVGELVLTNQGVRPALLVAGELFEGGWQHRALTNDVLLVPGQQLVASVSCVEHGRWDGATAQVRPSRRTSVMVRCAQTIADEGERQSQVWQRVSRYDTAFGASATASYVDHLNHQAGAQLSDDGQVQGSARGELVAGMGKIRPLLGQRGVLIGLGGQPAFVELFASTSALRRHLPGLLEAAAIDAALLPAQRTPGRRARRFAGDLAAVPIGAERGADAGSGHAMASRSACHEIRGLGWDDHLLHATVFNRRHPMMEVA